jgi:uncharacterized membrane protein
VYIQLEKEMLEMQLLIHTLDELMTAEKKPGAISRIATKVLPLISFLFVVLPQKCYHAWQSGAQYSR